MFQSKMILDALPYTTFNVFHFTKPSLIRYILFQNAFDLTLSCNMNYSEDSSNRSIFNFGPSLHVLVAML